MPASFFSNLSARVVATTLVAAAGVLAACSTVEKSSDVAQKRVYMSYSAAYDEEVRALSLRAGFNVGNAFGNALRLEGDSRVRANGTPLSEGCLGRCYSLNQEGISDEQAFAVNTFEYVNNDGQKYENSISVPGRVHFTVAPVVSGQADLSISWKVDAPAAGDFVVLTLTRGDTVESAPNDPQPAPEGDSNTQPLQSDNFSSTLAQGQTEGSFTIPAARLREFGRVEIKARMTRTRTADIVGQTEAGGKITGRFESATRRFQVDF